MIAQHITTPLRYGGGSGNTNSCTFNKLCVDRHFSVSNPPQIKNGKIVFHRGYRDKLFFLKFFF